MSKRLQRCALCKRGPGEVRLLILGPAGAQICDHCTEQAGAALEEHRARLIAGVRDEDVFGWLDDAATAQVAELNAALARMRGPGLMLSGVRPGEAARVSVEFCGRTHELTIRGAA